MLPEYKSQTNIGVGIGFVLSVIGNLLVQGGGSMVGLGYLLAIVGTVIFIWGCWGYAQGKGYHGALGLLGLLSCVGLIILVLLPDKNK